jgi:hypothetical protein
MEMINMSNKFYNRDPQGVGAPPVIHQSGTPRPTPTGPHHDPRQGGEIKIDSLIPASQKGNAT